MKRATITYAEIYGNRFGDSLMRVEYRGKLLWQSEHIGSQQLVKAVDFCLKAGFTHYTLREKRCGQPATVRYTARLDARDYA